MARTLLNRSGPRARADRLKCRDRKAWDRLVDDQHARLFNLHLRLTGDREAAADLTQETFAEAYRTIDGYSGEAPPEAWLYGVAMNVNRTWWRRRGREEAPVELEEDIADPDPTAEQLAQMREHTELVCDAIRRLPELYRRAVALRYFAGLSAAEIARDEGVDAGTVRWRLHQALRKMWVMLQPQLGEGGQDEQGAC